MGATLAFELLHVGLAGFLGPRGTWGPKRTDVQVPKRTGLSFTDGSFYFCLLLNVQEINFDLLNFAFWFSFIAKTPPVLPVHHVSCWQILRIYS